MTTYTIDLDRVHSLYELHALWDSLHHWFEFPDQTTIEVLGMDRVSKDLEIPISRLKGVLDDLHTRDGVHVVYR